MLFPLPGWCADIVGQVKKPIGNAVDIRQRTQHDSDVWARQKTGMEAEFETLTDTHESLAAAKMQLQEELERYSSRLQALETQQIEMTRLADEIIPFLHGVHDRLDTFVKSDLPFLLDERTARLQRLERLIDDPDYSVGEKYRKTMEALLIEVEYGNTIEVYNDNIPINGESILANVFRLGRISIFFETLDHKTAGVYDPAAGGWKVLPPKYNTDIGKAIEIGMKRRSVELLTLPLGRIAAQ